MQGAGLFTLLMPTMDLAPLEFCQCLKSIDVPGCLSPQWNRPRIYTGSFYAMQVDLERLELINQKYEKQIKALCLMHARQSTSTNNATLPNCRFVVGSTWYGHKCNRDKYGPGTQCVFLFPGSRRMRHHVACICAKGICKIAV